MRGGGCAASTGSTAVHAMYWPPCRSPPAVAHGRPRPMTPPYSNCSRDRIVMFNFEAASPGACAPPGACLGVDPHPSAIRLLMNVVSARSLPCPRGHRLPPITWCGHHPPYRRPGNRGRRGRSARPSAATRALGPGSAGVWRGRRRVSSRTARRWRATGSMRSRLAPDCRGVSRRGRAARWTVRCNARKAIRGGPSDRARVRRGTSPSAPGSWWSRGR